MDSERIINISGDFEHVRKSALTIAAIIQEDPSLRDFMHTSYPSRAEAGGAGPSGLHSSPSRGAAYAPYGEEPCLLSATLCLQVHAQHIWVVADSWAPVSSSMCIAKFTSKSLTSVWGVWLDVVVNICVISDQLQVRVYQFLSAGNWSLVSRF